MRWACGQINALALLFQGPLLASASGPPRLTALQEPSLVMSLPDPVLADPPHILVVDDDARIRDLLSRFLKAQGFLVTTAAQGQEAQARLGGVLFDLLIVDIMMPGLDGLGLTRWLRGQAGAQGAETPVLLLTARDAPEDRITGLEAGADDYLSKPFEPRELVLRVKAILKRVGTAPRRAEDKADPDQPLVLGPLRYAPLEGRLWSADTGEDLTLSATEAALLRALAARSPSVIDRVDLARLTGQGGNDRTIDVQITRLRRKVEPDPRNPRYIVTVRGAGYSLRPDPSS